MNLDLNLTGSSSEQGTTFEGKKFQIFLEKAIIDLKHHFWHFLMEDFYIFIFFYIYCQENISFNFFAIFIIVFVFDPYNFNL